jgi:thiamine pyrophosphokinase
MKRALFFAHGDVSENEFRKIKNIQFDIIIAADGGALNALQGGYRPDYVVGDLDSISADINAKLPDTEFIHRPSQELNDLEKALIFCQEQGVTDITLLGISGKRLDHTLNNLSVFCRYDQNFEMTIYDAHSRIYIVRDKWHYSAKPNQLISLIPVGIVEGVKTEGLAFPLNNEPLIFGEREGLSNYIVSNPVKVKIKNGILFVFILDR